MGYISQDNNFLFVRLSFFDVDTIPEARTDVEFSIIFFIVPAELFTVDADVIFMRNNFYVSRFEVSPGRIIVTQGFKFTELSVLVFCYPRAIF